MARYSGNSGVIKAVTTGGTVASTGEVKQFNISASQDDVPASSIGQDWEDSLGGLKRWEGGLTANYDPADAAQADLIEGAEVDVELFPIGETSGRETLTGTARVSSIEISVGENEVVSYVVSFKGKGALTRGTVA